MIFSHPVIAPMLALGSSDPGERLKAAQHFAHHLLTPGYLDILRQHRLTPLIYQTLTSFPRQDVGKVPHLKELRQDYLWALRQYKFQELETHKLLEVISEAGVEVILLKGADIRHRLYDEPATRLMGDVDVLISPADLERVRLALKGQGYTVMPRDLDLQPDFAVRFSYVFSVKTPLGGVKAVDVHWEIREAGAFYRLPYNPLRARAVTREVQGKSVLVLAPEHVLMHLCLHTFDELECASILKIVDLDRALGRLPLDWDLFLEDAARFGIQGPVFWIFREMARLSPGAIPGTVLEKLAAYQPGWTEKFILRRQASTLLVASVAVLWRYLPLRTWAPYLKAKLWPSSAYLRANADDFPSRADYLRHLLGRVQEKT